MDQDGMVIQVSGIPDNYPCSSMIDKLTMHFLRRSNNGGDVLTVIYPTSIESQAFVVFEQPEVHGVLQQTHVLEVDGKFYPLNIKRGYLPQLHMPAEAKLDVSMFSRQKEITDLLHSYGFSVSQTRSGHLHLQGSFLKLKIIRAKLMQLLAQETRNRSGTTSPYTNGYSNGSASDYDHSSPESINEFPPRLRHISGRSVYAEAGSPSIGATSGHRLSWTDSPAEGHYSTQHTLNSPRTRILPSTRDTKTSFPVESDVFRYAMSFKREDIQKIKSEHRTEIKSEGDSDLVTVTLSGGAFMEASKALSSCIHQITSSLRTQEIDLNMLDSIQKQHISQHVGEFQKSHRVLITQHANILRIIGSSEDSYQAKKKILELKSDSLLGSLQNNTKRRSISLTRHRRSRKDDVLQSPDHMIQAAADSGYSASRYQTDFTSQQAALKERGRQLDKSDVQRRRAQSASESRCKNKKTYDKDPSPLDQQAMAPSTGAGTSKKGQSPTIFKSLIPASFSRLHTRKKI